MKPQGWKTTGVAALGAFTVLSFSSFAADSGSGQPPAAAPSRQLISADDFGALPFMNNPQLSPNGKFMLSRTYANGKRYLSIFELGAKTTIAHSLSPPESHDLLWYRWAGDGRVLMSLGTSSTVFGEDVYVTRLMMYDLATRVTSFVGRRDEGIDGDDIVHVARDGSWLLLSVQKTIYDYPSVWRVDLATLKMKQIVSPQAGVWDWFADSGGTVRAGLGVAGRNWWLLYRKDADSRFEKVVRRKLSDSEEGGSVEKFVPIDGSDHGYAVANTRTGRYGLYHYDFATDSLGEPIFEHPQVDIDDFRMSEKGEIEAVYYTDDRSRVDWLNPKMKEIQAEIDQALPNRINRVMSVSADGLRMIVWTVSASDPGAYYHFQYDAGRMSMLARPYQQMNGKALSNVESTHYPARDGLVIPAYITQPRDVEPKLLPLIVMPHGGPFARDEWNYDPWAQFLANRGYLVLQPNFRGSTGYGRQFVEKGVGQWGRTMQDDLDDGVKWLVDQGKVDPKRVCIMGASYGGYAAMWAAARNPEIYRCAISFAGISDLAAMIRYDRKAFAATRYYRAWREKVQGDKSFDLDTVSPLYAVTRIGVPLLIAHGDKDENVPVSQSKKLHDALSKANKAHEFVVYEGEGHGLQNPENAAGFLKRVEDFLRAHNPADASTTSPAP